jgi:hypothetical protein
VDDLAIQVHERCRDIRQDRYGVGYGQRGADLVEVLPQGPLGPGHDDHPGVVGLTAVDHGHDVADAG